MKVLRVSSFSFKSNNQDNKNYPFMYTARPVPKKSDSAANVFKVFTGIIAAAVVLITLFNIGGKKAVK